jgi:hypothetical protein
MEKLNNESQESNENHWITYQGHQGSGVDKHIVLLAVMRNIDRKRLCPC